jgi:hypothetical protein
MPLVWLEHDMHGMLKYSSSVCETHYRQSKHVGKKSVARWHTSFCLHRRLARSVGIMNREVECARLAHGAALLRSGQKPALSQSRPTRQMGERRRLGECFAPPCVRSPVTAPMTWRHPGLGAPRRSLGEKKTPSTRMHGLSGRAKEKQQRQKGLVRCLF